MKKFLTCLLAFVLVFAMVMPMASCAETPEETTTKAPEATTEGEKNETTESKAPAAPEASETEDNDEPDETLGCDDTNAPADTDADVTEGTVTEGTD